MNGPLGCLVVINFFFQTFSLFDSGWRSSQPQTIQPQTFQQFSTLDISTMNFWTMGLESSWLKSLWLKCHSSSRLNDISIPYVFCSFHFGNFFWFFRHFRFSAQLIKKRNHEFTYLKCCTKAREPFKTPFKRCIISYLKKTFRPCFFYFRDFKKRLAALYISELVKWWFCGFIFLMSRRG